MTIPNSPTKLVAALVDRILLREGGEFTDDPLDRGGPTKYGITQATLTAWMKRQSTLSRRSATAVEVRNLDLGTARAIYEEMYIRDPGFLKLPYFVIVDKMVDMGVHHSPAQAIFMLQEVVNSDRDGVLGPVTVANVRMRDPLVTLTALVTRRNRRFIRICRNDPSQLKYLEGWINRSNAFLPYA